MYTEESADDMTVTVEGEDYLTEATVDLNEDGVDDTAVVETDDGAIAFTDTDADGQADLMTQLDANGDIIGQARFDESTGEWVHVDPDDPAVFDEFDETDEQAADGGTDTMTVDTPQGEVQVGAPTHDTDSDGKADSVVVEDSDGETVIYTDADEDGDADYATTITGEGQVTVSEHTGDGEWTVIERGHLDEHGDYQRDSLTADTDALSEAGTWSTPGQTDAAEVRVDPRTGNWVRG